MRDTAITFISLVNNFFKQAASWWDRNWHVYAAFDKECLALIAAGKKRISARDVVGNLSHNTNLREVDGEFKIGNDNAPYFARLFIFLHPEHSDIFEFRFRDQSLYAKACADFRNNMKEA